MSDVNPSSCISVPSKAFLLGEYSILAGYPALLATLGPRFELLGESDSKSEFHPGSPVGKLIGMETARARRFGFRDPHEGRGGFGASTAEYILYYLRLKGLERSELRSEKEVFEIWDSYREHSQAEGVSPSGADLLAQISGGISWVDTEKRSVENLWGSMDWSGLLVFSATDRMDRKVATHEHLRILKPDDFEEGGSEWVRDLGKVTAKGIAAIQRDDRKTFGECMSRYADILFDQSLECLDAHYERVALMSLPGVLGVKGCGAYLSDATIVLTEGNPEGVIHVARKYGLSLVSKGLVQEPGVLFE